jgi:hypothetical protein
MPDFAKLFDAYNRQARLYPALIALGPAVWTVLAWFPDLVTGDIGKALVALFVAMGIFYALGVMARSFGKAVEKRLLAEWGGWPTTIWLRHREEHLDPETRGRYHRYLMRVVPDLLLPTATEEARDLVHADRCYASAVKWLQEQCRGKDWPLVEKENAEYGFRRNLRGLKPVALLIALLALIVSAGAPLLPVPTDPHDCLEHALRTWQSTSFPVLGAMVLDAIALIVWTFWITDRWVREAGDQFARVLLAGCDRLAQVR